MALRKKDFIALTLIIFLYAVFFFPLLKSNKFFWDSDAEIKHYPTREFLFRSIRNDKTFPLWTEKVLFGHALYSDMENAYLNPVNVISIVLAGPVVSYKIVHFLSVVIGSFALYKFLERKRIGVIPFLAACLVYFYSFFHLNHTIHLNMLPVTLLFPLNILLVDLFISTLKKKHIFLQAIVVGYGLLWGHPQSSILVFLGILIYTCFLDTQLGRRGIVKYLFFTLALSTAFALPQIVPTAKAYINSYRNYNSVNAALGSLTPELTISYIFPYIFSTSPYFYGERVSEEFSYTELYNYVGIVAILLAGLNILFGKKDKLFYFSYALIIAFLVLGYLKYLPLIHLENLPIVSSFRYWTRSVFLLSFALALNTALTLQNNVLIKRTFSKKRLHASD